MLPLAPALERLLKRPDGRWQPKIELLTAAQEDISDSKERMSQGTVSPASALTFDDDGSVRLAATGQSYISYNTGAAFFSTLQPILGKDTNHCGMWLFEKDIPGVVLNITKVTLHLSRRPNGGLPPFDGVFRLQAFTVIRNRLTEPSGQEFGNPFLHATVDVAASDVAWVARGRCRLRVREPARRGPAVRGRRGAGHSWPRQRQSFRALHLPRHRDGGH
jgi:hypothetical protein